MDPDHRPARLLAGYALLRLDADASGLAVLESLAREPVLKRDDVKVRALAVRAVHRVDDPRRRDQVSLAYATTFAPERGGERGTGAWHLANAYVWQLGVPLTDGVTLRVEAQHRFVTDNEDVGGWRLTPMLAFARGASNHSVDLGVGPTTWVARGIWWEGGTHVYAGARLAAGVDWRYGRRFGLRLEVAATPLLLDSTLWWYGSPFDARFSVSWWLGQPRHGPLRATAAGG